MAGVEQVKFGMVIAGKEREIEVTALGKANFFSQFRMAKERGLVPVPLAVVDEGIMKRAISLASWTGSARFNGPFEQGKDTKTANGSLVLRANDIAKTGVPYGRSDTSIISYLSSVDSALVTAPDLRLTYTAINLVRYGYAGQVDKVIRLPVRVPEEVWVALPEDQKRWFHGQDGPLARGDGLYGFRRDVLGLGSHGRFWMYGVKPEVLEMLAEAKPTAPAQC